MCLKGLIKVPMMLSCFMQKSWKSWLQIEKNLQVWCFSILCQVAKESRSLLDGGGRALIRTSFGSSPLPLLESCFPMCCPPQCPKAKTLHTPPWNFTGSKQRPVHGSVTGRTGVGGNIYLKLYSNPVANSS